jgi:acyl transferase domain-containing protein/acyl carrier protein
LTNSTLIQMTSIKKYDGLEIAIIGMSGRFPQSDDYREFWQHLKDGKELLKTYSDEELRLSGVPESSLQDSRYVKTVGVVDNKDCFDAGFFGYSIPEATFMDPQIRVFHEQCWSALDDAGYTAQIDKQRIGVYGGASVNDNWKLHAYAQAATSGVEPFYLSMISAHRFITTLVSYKLNLRGPSVFTDTACSTSLTAVQLACRSLLTRDCSLALAGGVSLKTQKGKGYFYQEGMVSSDDGHCRTFDVAASGTASGEGAGVVVLKRLSEAIKDGDHVYAVIRAAVLNNDGSLKVGYAAPSVKGQADCVRTAQRMAGVPPQSITYVEAHGTATKLGDPVEVRALNEAFGVGGEDKYCAIGSVKSNLGHLDAAAGMAGLIKAALCLKHRQLPASLHFTKPNPEIDFESGPFYVNTSLRPWTRSGNFPLRAGLSSLGIGGTNAHLILEEAPELEAPAKSRPYQLLTVSAKTAGSVSRYLGALEQFLLSDEEVNLADMAYTLQVGRKHFPFRKALVFQNRQELIGLLQAARAEERLLKGSERRNKTVFLFSGAGSQYVTMGKGLYEAEAVFRTEMDKGFDLLQQLTGEDYRALFYPTQPGEYRINNMLHAQPAIFLFEYALAQLLLSYGVTPDYMMGHSVGEYVAACLSGVFTFEDALKLVVQRGQLMNSLPEGAMLSASIQESEARQYLSAQVSLAAVNGPEQVVFAGSIPAIHALAARLEQQDVSSALLHATHAGHSFMMDPILEKYREAVRAVPCQAPQIPFVSCLTGNLVTAEECMSADYWVRHMRETVRFSDGVATLAAAHDSVVFVELGASNALTTLIRQRGSKQTNLTAVNLVRHPKEQEDDARYLLERMGQLWTRGVDFDWSALYRDERRRRVSLPTYAFEPLRFPAEVDPFVGGLFAGNAQPQPTTKQSLQDWLYYPTWKSAVYEGPTAGTQAESFLLFSPSKGFSRTLGTELAKGEHQVVEVLAGEEYQQLSRLSYVLDPAQKEHFSRLFQALQADGVAVSSVLYAWPMGAVKPFKPLAEDAQTFNLAYLGLVHFMQALARQHELAPKGVAVITDSLHQVLGTEKAAYAQALVLGLVRVIPQEYGLPCYNIDVDGQTPGSILALAKEISYATTSKDSVVALRHGKRWLEDFEKHVPREQPAKKAWTQGGKYLITGGLGNVGFTLAKHLLEQYGATVILLGRKDLAESSAPIQQKWQELQQLSQQLSYWRLDVADAAELERLVAAEESQSGPINGVIHAAGVTDDSYFELIEDITPAKALTMFSPKVMGLESLYSVFGKRSPEFVWLTSSLSTVLGGLSFASYVSANAYMNHFAVARAEELPNWKCMVVGGISFNEQDLEKEDEWNRTALNAAEVVELFEWSLAGPALPLVLQSTGDLWARKRHTSKGNSENSLLQPTPVLEEEVQNRLERPDLSTTYVAPATATEEKLKDVFEDFFGIAGIGVEDHFFELGGDSLKGMMLLKRIKKEFSVQLPLRDFLVNATIRFIAEKLDELAAEPLESKKPEVSIEPVRPQASYPVSSSQFRMWLLSQVPESSVAYNMPGMYEFEGELQPESLTYAFHALMERHESLRTVFREDEEGGVRQHILAPDAVRFGIAFQDIRTQQNPREWLQTEVQGLFTQPFDLAVGPLLRAGLYQVEDHKWVFAYVMHHIVGDGWSMGIVMKELFLLYTAHTQGKENPLRPLRIQYKDYAAWQQTQLSGSALEGHKAYWLQQLSGELPVLDIPGSRVRPAVKTYRGDSVAKVIPADLGRDIRSIVQGYGSTLFMGLLAAVNVLLHKHTDQEDIVIGTPILGREHLDLEDQVGFYLNTLALRARISPADSYRSVLDQIQQVTLGAYEHQVFPFDQLLDELGLTRDMSRNPLFDIMLILQNTQGSNTLPPQENGPLRIRGYEGRKTLTSKFDLTFDFVEAGDEIHLNLVFNRDLFPRSTVEQLADDLERLLASIVVQPHAPVRQLEYLSPDEKQSQTALQAEFNAAVSEEF